MCKRNELPLCRKPCFPVPQKSGSFTSNPFPHVAAPFLPPIVPPFHLLVKRTRLFFPTMCCCFACSPRVLCSLLTLVWFPSAPDAPCLWKTWWALWRCGPGFVTASLIWKLLVGQLWQMALCPAGGHVAHLSSYLWAACSMFFWLLFILSPLSLSFSLPLFSCPTLFSLPLFLSLLLLLLLPPLPFSVNFNFFTLLSQEE